MEIEIRKLSIDDLPAAAELEKDTFSAPWSAKMMQDAMTFGTLFLGAFVNGVFAGHMSILTVLDEGQICNLAVCPDRRRQGVATALLRGARELLIPYGVKSLVLDVRASNLAAQALYEKNGFAPIGRRRNFYSSPKEDGLLYLLQLS